MADSDEKVTTLYAFVGTRADGTEAVVGGKRPDGSEVPLIAIDEERMEALLPLAQQVSDFSGLDIRVVRYDRVDAEVYEGPAISPAE